MILLKAKNRAEETETQSQMNRNVLYNDVSDVHQRIFQYLWIYTTGQKF